VDASGSRSRRRPAYLRAPGRPQGVKGSTTSKCARALRPHRRARARRPRARPECQRPTAGRDNPQSRRARAPRCRDDADSDGVGRARAQVATGARTPRRVAVLPLASTCRSFSAIPREAGQGTLRARGHGRVDVPTRPEPARQALRPARTGAEGPASSCSLGKVEPWDRVRILHQRANAMLIPSAQRGGSASPVLEATRVRRAGPRHEAGCTARPKGDRRLPALRSSASWQTVARGGGDPGSGRSAVDGARPRRDVLRRPHGWRVRAAWAAWRSEPTCTAPILASPEPSRGTVSTRP